MKIKALLLASIFTIHLQPFAYAAESDNEEDISPPAKVDVALANLSFEECQGEASAYNAAEAEMDRLMQEEEEAKKLAALVNGEDADVGEVAVDFLPEGMILKTEWTPEEIAAYAAQEKARQESRSKG